MTLLTYGYHFSTVDEARRADNTFMRAQRKQDRRGRWYAPPGVGYRCNIGQHSMCFKKFCTCTCGHPATK